MERLRYVAGAGSYGLDPISVVSETAEALGSLRPTPSALVNVLRQLVVRHPTCGPLWWFGANLLTRGLDELWLITDELLDDATPMHLAMVSGSLVGATVVELAMTDGERVIVSSFDADVFDGAESIVVSAPLGTVVPPAYLDAAEQLMDPRRWVVAAPADATPAVGPEGSQTFSEMARRVCTFAPELIPPADSTRR